MILWFDFWDRLTTVLKVLKNKNVIFFLFSWFPFLKNYLLPFFIQELLLISFCFSSILFRFFLKNDLLPFLLHELLLIFCNNMIYRAVLMNKGFIFIYFLPVSFCLIFLWYDFVLFDFWDRLTTVLNVLKNKCVIFIFPSLFFIKLSCCKSCCWFIFATKVTTMMLKTFSRQSCYIFMVSDFCGILLNHCHQSWYFPFWMLISIIYFLCFV